MSRRKNYYIVTTHGSIAFYNIPVNVKVKTIHEKARQLLDALWDKTFKVKSHGTGIIYEIMLEKIPIENFYDWEKIK